MESCVSVKYRDRTSRWRRCMELLGVALVMLGMVYWMVVDVSHYNSLRSGLGLGEPLPEAKSLPAPLISPVPTVVEPQKELRALSGSSISSFQSTLRSCLGSYCMMEEFKTGTGQPVKRIGLLLPDTQLVNHPLWAQLVMVAARSNIQVLVSTHVPAYGYGRNHGWTRIVRMVDDIDAQALRLVSNASVVSDKTFELQVRQLVRWHCRLNHVAAHTSLLTVFMGDLLNRPVSVLDSMLSFVGVKDSKTQADTVAASEAFQTLKAYIDASHVNFVKGQRFGALAASVVQEELDGSDQLRKWPCPSFLDLEKDEPPLPHSRYFQLAADCSDSFVKCSVLFDRREQPPSP